MIKIDELRKFLIYAKNKAYVIKGDHQTFEDGTRFYNIKEGRYEYTDRYIGRQLDSGQEIISYKGMPIWSMVYRGILDKDLEDYADIIFPFLRKSLAKADPNLPLRGPKMFEEGNHKYTNQINGNLEDFVGIEKMFLNKKQVYKRNYAGGLIFRKD